MFGMSCSRRPPWGRWSASGFELVFKSRLVAACSGRCSKSGAEELRPTGCSSLCRFGRCTSATEHTKGAAAHEVSLSQSKLVAGDSSRLISAQHQMKAHNYRQFVSLGCCSCSSSPEPTCTAYRRWWSFACRNAKTHICLQCLRLGQQGRAGLLMKRTVGMRREWLSSNEVGSTKELIRKARREGAGQPVQEVQALQLVASYSDTGAKTTARRRFE